ncbi:Putative niacin/nicotinamide transporter NaiP [Cupriavidus numazuensis]|uniref:Niacin/nicotinamide transporter NaiP n=2 Tax=Cupriavidus numazuensis TaxID=221992 RepID=A0ABM8TE46_9BURK|nr:Putative niacin/nicotinamide transporter NaiP [Cupriavidus numazuensis]
MSTSGTEITGSGMDGLPGHGGSSGAAHDSVWRTTTEQSEAARIVAEVEALPLTPLHRLARVIVGSATFFDGFDVLAIAAAMPVLIKLWSLSPEQVGLIISIGYLGQLIGSLCFSHLADKFGRLRCASLSVALFALGSLACAFAGSPMSLMAYRFIQGLGLGGELPVAATYINELAKSEHRGRFVLFYELIFPIGLFAASLAGMWVVPHLGWQTMFFLGALPALIALCMRRFLPESPRWLASKGRFHEADAALERFRKYARAAGANGQPASLETRHKTVARQEPPATWQSLFRPPLLRRTFVLVSLWFAGGFVTAGVTSWMPTIYREVFHIDLATALKYGTYTSLAGIVGSAMCALAIDRFGRRLWMTMTWICAGFAMLAPVLFAPMTPATTAFCMSLAFGFTAAAFIGCYVYTPELYPTGIRTFGVGVSSAMLRLASIICPSMIGWFVARGSLSTSYVVIAGVAFAAALAVGLFGEETTGRTLEDASSTPQ